MNNIVFLDPVLNNSTHCGAFVSHSDSRTNNFIPFAKLKDAAL